MNIKRSILLRVHVAFLFVALFAIAVVVKIGHIQMVEGERWTAMGERITFDYKRVKATRGNIYSDNGSLLATSLPFYKIAFDATIPTDEVFKAGVDYERAALDLLHDFDIGHRVANSHVAPNTQVKPNCSA